MSLPNLLDNNRTLLIPVKTFTSSDAVMGLTFLAAGTSVPDLITSVLVAKEGKVNLTLIMVTVVMNEHEIAKSGSSGRYGCVLVNWVESV